MISVHNMHWSLPGGQLILELLDIFSLGLLPCVQLSGDTKVLVGDSELDIRLYGLKESSMVLFPIGTWDWAEETEPETKEQSVYSQEVLLKNII